VNSAEVALLLAWVAALDNRSASDAAVIAWAEVLPEDITLAEAKAAAARHFRDVPGVYLMPAHVVAGVRAARAERLRAVPDPLPPVDPDDVRAFQEARRALRWGIAREVSRKEIGA
jgi:hypothetical protein